MAIDDLIAAGVRPPQVADPMTVALHGMQMRDWQQQAFQRGQLGQLAAMRTQAIGQDMADERTIRDALGQTGGNLDQALPMLAGKISGDRYTALQTNWLNQQRDKIANASSLERLQNSYHEALGDLANGVKQGGYTPESFEAATTLAQHLHPGMADLLNPYIAQARQDPSTIKRMTDQWIAETASGRAGEQDIRAQQAADEAQGREQRAQELQPFQVSEAASRATTAAQQAAGTTPITPYQQRMLDIDNQREADMQWYRKQEIAQGWARQQGGDGGLTPNAREVTKRLQMRQLQDMIDQEAGLHKLRLQLGNAIGNPSHSIYVDEKGNIRSMDKASEGDADTKNALVQEMQDRFNQATTQVNDIIARKNDLAGQLGMQPRVSTEQAQSAVTRGTATRQGAVASSSGAQAAATSQYQPGQYVMHKGQQRRIRAVLPGNKLELE